MRSLIVIAALAVSALTLAQNTQNQGTLTVNVKDASGNAVPGVIVRVMASGAGTSGVTNERGSIELRVAAGSSRLTASLPGFYTLERQITLKDAEQITLDLTMSIAPPQSQLPPGRFDRDRNFGIRADNMVMQGNTVLYRGNVRMTTDSVEIRSDELDFNTVTRSANVRGNVTVQLLPVGARMVPVTD